MIIGRDNFPLTATYGDRDPQVLRLDPDRPVFKITAFVQTNEAMLQVSEDVNAILPDPDNPDELRLSKGHNSLTFMKGVTGLRLRCAISGQQSQILYLRLYGPA